VAVVKVKHTSVFFIRLLLKSQRKNDNGEKMEKVEQKKERDESKKKERRL